MQAAKEQSEQLRAEIATQAVTIETAAKEYAALKQTLVQNVNNSGRTPARLSKIEAENRELSQQITEYTKGKANLDDLGPCPFPGCALSLGKLSRVTIARHLKTHAFDNSEFACPLLIGAGKVCNYLMNKDDALAISGHYIHAHGHFTDSRATSPVYFGAPPSYKTENISRLRSDNVSNANLLSRGSGTARGSSSRFPTRTTRSARSQTGGTGQTASSGRLGEGSGGGDNGSGGIPPGGPAEQLTMEEVLQRKQDIRAQIRELSDSELPPVTAAERIADLEEDLLNLRILYGSTAHMTAPRSDDSIYDYDQLPPFAVENTRPVPRISQPPGHRSSSSEETESEEVSEGRGGRKRKPAGEPAEASANPRKRQRAAAPIATTRRATRSAVEPGPQSTLPKKAGRPKKAATAATSPAVTRRGKK